MTNIKHTNTSAFYIQAALSFAVALSAVMLGILYLPAEVWMRAFLAVSVLYVVTSAFTLAKVVRDNQEEENVIHRIDEARLERLLSEHDPYSPAPIQ